MNTRTVVGLVTAGVLVTGVVAWVAGMPEPDGTSASALAAVPAMAIGLPGIAATSAAAPNGVDQSDGALPTGTRSAMDGVVDAGWLASTAQKTGIPERALEAYAGAAVREKHADPGCGVAWNTLAAIGTVESGNGTHGGAHIDASGQLVGQILGPELNGQDFQAVPDSDHGELDGDAKWDRAVGPMQFLPSTWALDGIDGNGDGKADPNQIDDAALTAAAYLCRIGGDLTTGAGWEAAITGYNADPAYAEQIRQNAEDFAQEVAG
jgi:hypothetical protein